MTDTRAKTPELDLDQTLIPWIGRTSKLMMIYMAQQMQECKIDLTPKQFIALKYLLNENGCEQKHLATITERDKTSLTRLISTLEKKGLVERRTASHDKRINTVHITEKGHAAYVTALPIAVRSIHDIEQVVDAEEMKTAIATIRKMHDAVKRLTNQKSLD